MQLLHAVSLLLDYHGRLVQFSHLMLLLGEHLFILAVELKLLVGDL